MPDQRVIKFRAWDKSKKRMGNVLRLSLLPDRMGSDSILGADVLFEGSMAETVFGDDIVFMQFTGLTDVDGKEIYEGDVVEITMDRESAFESTGKYRVTWENELACFMILNKDDLGTAIMGFNKEEIKVTGNIWENKEE